MRVWAAFLLICALGTTQCKLEPKEVKGRLKVLCTTTIAADAVKQIVGDKADVITLMGPGVDPHEFVPRQGDMEKMADAHVIVYHGLSLEGKMGDEFRKLEKNPENRLIDLSKGLSESDLLGGDHDHEHLFGSSHGHSHEHDPHIWNDVMLWSKTIKYLSKELAKVKPDHGEFFESNAKRYVEELETLNSELSSLYGTIPESKRVLVTAHDAFGYLGRAHGFDVKSLQGITTTAEFGVRDVTLLADYIMKEDIKSMFLESSISPKNLEAVIAHCNAEGHSIKIGGQLYSDALGDPGSDAGSYIGMMKANAKTIVDGLK